MTTPMFACKKCDREFPQAQGLRMHVARAHGKMRGSPTTMKARRKKRKYTKRKVHLNGAHHHEPAPRAVLNYCPNCGHPLAAHIAAASLTSERV